MARNQNATTVAPNQQLQKLISKMIDDKKAIVAEAPIWVAKTTFATLKRDQGTIINDGRGIIFRDLSGELAPLNGVTLNLKGKGPLVKVCHAVAVADKSGEYNGKPWSIKKGSEMVRCWS